MASEQNMCMTRSRFLVSGSRTSSWNGSCEEGRGTLPRHPASSPTSREKAYNGGKRVRQSSWRRSSGDHDRRWTH